MRTFVQVKRKWRKDRRAALKQVAQQTLALKREGYTSNGWSNCYGTSFRHWGKNDVNDYLEWANPRKVVLCKLKIVSDDKRSSGRDKKRAR